jgi:hypothetical protein
MRRSVSMVCVAFVGFAGVWLAAPAAAGSGSCSGDVTVPIGTKLRGHPSLSSVTVDLAEPIGPGEYVVTSFSSDTRSGTDKVQEHEQWTVTLVATSGPMATLGPTTDLEDHVEYASVADTLGRVVVVDPVVSLTIRHATGTGGGDSVTAECVGFAKVGEPPPAADEPPAIDPGGDDTPPGPEPGAGGDQPPPVPDPGDGEPAPVPGAGGDQPPPVPDPGDGDPRPSPTVPPAAPARISSAALVDCGEGTIRVTVLNDGGTGATVDVAVPRSGVTHALGVAPGRTSTTTVPISPDTEDHRLAIRVVDSTTGGDLASSVVGVDCLDEPDVAASIVLDCPANRIRVDLANRGGEPARVAILSERDTFEQVDLAAGSTGRVDVEIAGREAVPVLVLAEGGLRVLDTEVEVDCPRARLSASADVDCSTGEVVVEASNDGELTGSATVWFSDRPLEVRVEAGSVVSVGSPLSAMRRDPAVSVDSGGETIYSTTVEDDCVDPGAQLDADCDSLALDLTNDGDGTAGFGIEMRVGGVPALRHEISVPPGRTGFDLPPVDDYSWEILVTEASREEPVAEFSGERDCRRPWAEIEIDCPADTAAVRLGVVGRPGARFVVLADDVVVDRWTAVGAETTTERALTLEPGVETMVVLADASSGPLATSPVLCDERQAGGASRTATAVVAAMVVISLATAVVWKGI